MKTPQFNLPMKAGHTTTEFWLVIITGLLTTTLTAISLLDVAWGVGAITVLTLVYTAQRNKLKVIQAKTEAEAIKADLASQARADEVGLTVTPPPSQLAQQQQSHL